jgi:hypothetical protein
MSYGLEIYGPIINGDATTSKLVFSDSIRTSNIQVYSSFSLSKDQTSSVYACPNANDGSKILIVFVGNPRYVDVINKTSTGFQLQNNSGSYGTQSGIVMALRIS